MNNVTPLQSSILVSRILHTADAEKPYFNNLFSTDKSIVLSVPQ